MFEDLVDGEMAFEDEVAAVFDLVEGGIAAQVDGFAIFLRKLGAQEPGPVVPPFLPDGALSLSAAAWSAFGSEVDRNAINFHVALIKDGITRIVNGLEDDDHAKSPSHKEA